MLGKEAAEQPELSPQQVSTRLTTALSGDHEGDAVGGMGIVRGKASSNGRSKLRHQDISRWRGFGGMAPGLVGKGLGHGNGTTEPGIEGGAT